MRTACTRWFAASSVRQPAKPTGWCSWQGLVTLPAIADPHVATMMIGEHGNLGLWPAGGSDLQWWFDLPWSSDFVRPQRPIEMIRSHFTGWSDTVDQVLATLTDDDLAPSPFPHFRHPIPRAGAGALTLLGDAAHTMPPTLAQGTNQALLDTMVLRKALSDFETSSTARVICQRAALVREHPAAQGQGGVLVDHAAGVSPGVRAATGGADLGPVHDVGADDVPGLGQSPRHLGGDQP